jgi:uracil-DNA glycosylase family 4
MTKWEEYKILCVRCRECHHLGLLDPNGFPLFMKHPPLNTDILFVFEAPNKDDTYNPSKQYLTVDPDTDPSGTFFYRLFTDQLGMEIEKDLFVTNSVLCLPCSNGGKHPVRSQQMARCVKWLRSLIDTFDPLIICPLGAKALRATALIDDHGYRRMRDAVARPISWYGRILFPLYHTSSQARNPRNGRVPGMQEQDWETLKAEYERIRHNKSLQRMADSHR